MREQRHAVQHFVCQQHPLEVFGEIENFLTLDRVDVSVSSATPSLMLLTHHTNFIHN